MGPLSKRDRSPIVRRGRSLAVPAAVLGWLAIGSVWLAAAPPSQPDSRASDSKAPDSNVAAARVPDFSDEVRPILADHCFTCHGQDPASREAGLRLDQPEAAMEDLGGYQAIAPGDPEKSEVWLRIIEEDPDMRMPPPGAAETLSSAQIETLRRWIESGAAYESHWSFEPPQRPALPAFSDPAWSQQPIDRFVWARLEAAGMQPAPPADPYELVQRLYLDLTGLPPSPEQADAFVHDPHPAAYTRLVDRLLASPEYAEHHSRRWLDLARYADTNGYEKDRPRSVWPYRDWVIKAINEDMPFDQFTIEQLAGDMLPGATVQQRIATGFHRMTMLNEEGGIDPLEYRFHAMVDRVATTGTVWMGLTVGCAQCHTHKYDPITHQDYYRLMALLNQADEPEQLVPDAAVKAERERVKQAMAEVEQRLRKRWLPSQQELQQQRSPDAPEKAKTTDVSAERAAVHQAFANWLQQEQQQARAWNPLVPQQVASTMPRLEVQSDGAILASGDVTKRDVYTLTFQRGAEEPPITALRLVVLPHPSLPAEGPGMAFYEGRRGDFFLSELRLRQQGQAVALGDASHSYGNISVGSGSAAAEHVIDDESSTGWSTSGREGESHHLVVNLKEPLEGSGTFEVELLFERHFAAALGHFRLDASAEPSRAQASDLPAALVDRLAGTPRAAIPEDLFVTLQNEFLRRAPELAMQRKPLESLERQLPSLPTTLVMRQRPPAHHRETHLHHRGEYLSPRETVTPAIPSMFEGLPEDAPADRLSLARWLVSERNPLVARVTVNRAWRNFFGQGIVRTAGDYGTQSEPPTHPQLLDDLALQLVEDDWSIKRLHRRIVMSATYQQSSLVSAEQRQQDPENRRLSRGPRYRRTAETIRDSVLKATGLLHREVGGPSVYPPQPAAVMALAYGGATWSTSQGGDRYRRSLYTFKKRTAPFAASAIFDAPTGENCIARRERSNTPLQSLTLLNDAMFLEMARSLAAEWTELPGDVSEKTRRLFRQILVRPPQPDEHQQVLQFVQEQRERLAADARRSPQEVEQQAWFLAARALLNVDEFVAR